MTEIGSEVVWRKSRFSGTGNNCVEVAELGEDMGVRDSKNPGVGHLALSRRSFAGLVNTAAETASRE